ncbi:ParB/Srx family N-terminal domain-containing protein, partial [Corynebacterium sp.]|uniref:ParB/Srx family N-terminal domain-containing protein n=1 Tax=Corynebacterium sp. TaxID=1720 RepID=UPI002A90B329
MTPTGELQHVPIEILHTMDGNPRQGDLDTIKDSLRRHGQYKPLLVRVTKRGEYEVLAGNNTLRAMRALNED